MGIQRPGQNLKMNTAYERKKKKHANPQGYTVGFTCTELFPAHAASEPAKRASW